jgi:hypothetical protein
MQQHAYVLQLCCAEASQGGQPENTAACTATVTARTTTAKCFDPR